MPEPSSLTDIPAMIRSVAYIVAATFTHPDDDWDPVMFAQHQSGAMMPPYALRDQFTTPGRKYTWMLSLPAIVRNLQAVRIGVLLPSWVSIIEPNADGSIPDWQDRPAPSEAINRIERLQLIFADADGITSWHADVYRSESPPTLGAWERTDRDEPATGVLADSLREAFTPGRAPA